jgi:hypothetical protein
LGLEPLIFPIKFPAVIFPDVKITFDPKLDKKRSSLTLRKLGLFG